MIHTLLNIFDWQRLAEWFEPIFTQPNGEILFTNLQFWLVFIMFLAIYLITIRFSRRTIMIIYTIAFNLFFAWKISGWTMLVLPATILVTWLITELIRQTKGKEKTFLLVLDILFTLLPLLLFKYSNAFLISLNHLVHTNFSISDLIAPVGISFYTLQSLSYTIDTYKGKFTDRATLLEYTFYLTFFPLLLAGPITRADVLIPQIKTNERPSDEVVFNGMWLIMIGLIKKCLFADYIAIYNHWIFEDPTGYSGFEVLIAMLGYIIQIYYDFSGYSDISIGIAAILGFRLADNFNFPLKSTNLTEFWRRWHISLSSWVRDYIYIPLGGNRKGTLRLCVNLIIAMTIAGLWHGANLTFIVWGALNGVVLAGHKLLKPLLDKIPNNWLSNSVCWLITISFVSLTMAFFGAVNINDSFTILKHGFSTFDIAYMIPFCQTRPMWVIFVGGGLILHLTSGLWYEKAKRHFIEAPWLVKIIIIIIAVQIIINLSNEDIQPFMYMQF